MPNNIPVEPSNSSKLVESNKILTDKIAVTHAMNKFAAPKRDRFVNLIESPYSKLKVIKL